VSVESTEKTDATVQALVTALGATLSATSALGRATPQDGSGAGALPVLSIDGADGDRSGAAVSDLGRAPADLQLLDVLGVGGMGVVYAARQRALDRDVAVKRATAEGATADARAALVGEGRVMGALEHPNIVPVHALGCDRDGLPVLVMKRIEGVVWRELLESKDHPMWARLGTSHARGLAFHVEVLMQVCNALHFAHSRGVLHRDVKPDNVMIGAFGEVYLLDWGIARPPGAHRSSRVVGTPVYMAPEMLVSPDTVDERADVYLLGATLHEVLAGKPPHEGTTIEEVFRSVLSPEPRAYPSTAPADLVALCRAAMHSDPTRRPGSCEAFRAALATYTTRRASRAMAGSALSKLEQVDERVGSDGAALEDAEIGVLLAECRFGLEMSLREWIENDVARKGLQRCLERSFERELRLRNAAAAGAALAALPEPRPALAARLATLEQELEAARALDQRHAERARDLDAGVSARPRILFLIAFIVVGGGLSTAMYLEELRTGQLSSMKDQVQLDVSILAFFLVGLAIGRRRLLANAYNKNVWALWLLGILGILGTDALFFVRDADVATATVVDFLILGIVFSAGALVFSRPLAAVALTGLSVAGLSAVWPRQSTLFGTFGLILALGLSIDQARRSAAKGS
jgi:eukaryotic-like serine/threonine-protein kinase